MMFESSVSLATIVVIAARAINILGRQLPGRGAACSRATGGASPPGQRQR
jgi:hypothetical protein